MLSVLNVAFPFAPVRGDSVGGAEQVVATLDRALVAAGLRSTVVAHASSELEGRLVPLDVPAGPIGSDARARVSDACRRAIDERLALGDIDVVHLHGLNFFDCLPDARVPVLAT